MVRRNAVVSTILVVASLSCAPNTGAGRPPAAAPTPGTTTPRVGTVAPPSVPTGTASAPQSTTSSGTPPDQRPAPAGAPPGGGRGGPPGGFQRRPQLTPEQNAARRDSLSAARAQVVQELMQRLAGSENKRAEDEFTNIKLMKDTTAAQLLKQMDYYGRSLSVSCTYCHEGGGKWDEDTKEEKNTARVMIQLVDEINTGGLTKMPPNRSGQTPKISCMTCHRGRTNPGNQLVP